MEDIFVIGRLTLSIVKMPEGLKDNKSSEYTDLLFTNENNVSNNFAEIAERYFKTSENLKVFDLDKDSRKNIRSEYVNGESQLRIIMSENFNNDFTTSKNLMSRILRFARRNSDSNFIMNHFEKVDFESYTEIFSGIKASLALCKDPWSCEILMTMEESLIESFRSVFEEYNLQYALFSRFVKLTYGFYNGLTDPEYDIYLKELIALICSKMSYADVASEITALRKRHIDKLNMSFEEEIIKGLKWEYDFYNNLKSQREKNLFKKFIYDSIQLYIKINEVFNRIDIFEVAFILREFEYDIYADEILNYLSEFQKAEKVKKCLIKRWQLTNKALEEKSSWGERDTISLDKKSTNNDDISFYSIKREKRKTLSLNKKLDWGANKIERFVGTFLKKYGVFLKRK
jgi:hypothetical protein